MARLVARAEARDEALPGGLRSADAGVIVAAARAAAGDAEETALRRIWARVLVDEASDVSRLVLLKRDGTLVPESDALATHLGSDEDAQIDVLCATRPPSRDEDAWTVSGEIFAQGVVPKDATAREAAAALAEDLARTIEARKRHAPETRLRATAPLVCEVKGQLQDFLQISHYVTPSAARSSLPPGSAVRERAATSGPALQRYLLLVWPALAAVLAAALLAFVAASR